MDLFFPISMILITILYAYRNIKGKNRALKATNEVIQQLNKQGLVLTKVSQSKKMNNLLVFLIFLTMAVFFIQDDSGLYIIRSTCLFILVVLIIESVFIDLKYTLFFNDNGFVRFGKYYPYKKIKAVGYSKQFYRPGKIFFSDNTSVSCFQDGLKTIYDQFSLYQTNKTLLTSKLV